MARATVRELKKKAAELLQLQAAYERYKALEQEVKADMVKLNYKEVDLGEAGRVFISISERVSVPVELAVRELGEDLAARVIIIKKSVSNEIVKTFVQIGEISEAQREALLFGADKTVVTSLYVRPLK
jgi:hypothetical protein